MLPALCVWMVRSSTCTTTRNANTLLRTYKVSQVLHGFPFPHVHVVV